MKKLKKPIKHYLKTKHTELSSEQLVSSFEDILVQYFLLYDNENQPTVLMNFKGMEWEEQDAKNFIDSFKLSGFFNNVDLENETIH